MTAWLRDSPAELIRQLRQFRCIALGRGINDDLARAVMSAAADTIEVKILGKERLPLHYSLGDRLRDAWACLRGRAIVLRRRDRSMW